MRVPSGAPVPFWLSVRNRIPFLKKSARPTLGTVAVATTLILTGVAVYSVCIYPKMNNDYYKKAQAEERARIHASREELAHGQRVWSDPFNRK